MRTAITGATFVVAVLFFSLPVLALEAAGVVERQKGDARRAADGIARPLSVGAKVFAGDVLKTGPEARLLVRFADGSSLTLGEKAEVLVDDMTFDPAGQGPQVGHQTLIMVVGVFRYTSGRIGKASPSQVAIGTRVATVGIRGTEFVGGELTVGMPPGQPHYGFQVKEGAIRVTSPRGSVILDDPGEGTFLPLAAVRAPTPVRQWTAEEAAEAEALLAF